MKLSVETAGKLLDFGARLRRSAAEPMPPQAAEQLKGAVAVHNLLATEGVAYLADEVGMGKTYVALGAIALFRHFQPKFRVAVVAPRENIQRKWMKEWFSFSTHLVKVKDLRVRGLDGGPARPMVACENLRRFVREASLDRERDFFLRMSSFSLAAGDEYASWRELRKRYAEELPWVSDELLGLRSKQGFKDNLAKAICCAIPTFDLLVIDEAHALKHGFSDRIAARNRVLAFVFGTAPEEVDTREFPEYGLRAKRVLLLSATPIDDDYRHLWNQLHVLGKAERYKALSDPHVPEDEKKRIARRFLLRRVTVLTTPQGSLTKNLYRREWRRGGLADHDQPIEITDLRRRLGVALVQKKVAEIINSSRFNSTFQMGMLASFESFLETAGAKDAEYSGNFDDSEQTEDATEREGVDVRSVNRLAEDYRRRFNAELPHPKMDALVDRLSTSWQTGRKALVFMRRVASVWEMKERLDGAYDAWLFSHLRALFDGHAALLQELDTLRAQYLAARGDRRALVARRAGVVKRKATEEDDRGGVDTFFAWYFRGEGPKGWLSGGTFSRRFIQARYAVSTMFEDNHVAALLATSPSGVRAAFARALDLPEADAAAKLNAEATWFLTEAKRPGRAELFEAVQAAGVELLMNGASDPATRARAQAVFHLRFHFRKQNEARAAVQNLEQYLGLQTLFSELRSARWSELRERIWPASTCADFAERFREQELRREMLAVATRLGHPAIDLYAMEMRERGTMEAGRQEEDTPSLDDTGPIDRLLALLEQQRTTVGADHGWRAFEELSALADQFDLILDVNEPQARVAPLQEAGRLFGALLRGQQPAAGMTGEVTRTVVRQFRMPGYPFVLLSTDLLQEGEDLHTFCADVYHYGLAWTPSAIEQRIGRVDRVRSMTERVVQAQAGPLDGDVKLQVFYPHLEDTVERLQVRRVLRRMNEFIRLMHDGLGGAVAEQSRLNVAREIHELSTALPVLDHVLETAFPVLDEQLHGLRADLAVPADEADRRLRRFEALRDVTLPGVDVAWDPVRELHAALGTARLPNGRLQPFGLYLQSVGSRLMVRCVSRVGKFEAGREWDQVAGPLAKASARVGVAEDIEQGTLEVSVQEDVLLGDEMSDPLRAAWLIRRVVTEADRLEEELLPETDAGLDSFRIGLANEGKVVGDGAGH